MFCSPNLYPNMMYRLHSSHTNLVKGVSVWVDVGPSERRDVHVDVTVNRGQSQNPLSQLQMERGAFPCGSFCFSVGSSGRCEKGGGMQTFVDREAGRDSLSQIAEWLGLMSPNFFLCWI